MSPQILKLKSLPVLFFSVGGLLLTILTPAWRTELQAQNYALIGPLLTIDICEVAPTGDAHVGGRLGEDSRIGETVFVSRGNAIQNVATVLGNGTFEGRTAPGFASVGETVTVGVRKTGGEGTLLSTCTLATSVGNRR